MDRGSGRRRPDPELPPPISTLTDDLLREIFLRLPPHPFHLASASCVCKAWHRVVRDEDFVLRFRRRHVAPPVLGFFGNPGFTAKLDGAAAGRRARRERFAVQIPAGRWWAYGCRHGRALLHERTRGVLLVTDLVTRRDLRLPTPPAYRAGCDALGTVLCADGHEHGDCRGRPFLVAFVFANRYGTTTYACVYSSESRQWGAVASISLAFSYIDDDIKHTALVGNTIYWLVSSYRILKYDLDSRTFDLVDESPFRVSIRCGDAITLMPTEDGSSLAIAGFEDFNLRFWSRSPGRDGALEWTVYRSIDLKQFLNTRRLRRLVADDMLPVLIGIAEEAGVIFIELDFCAYTIDLRSMQFAKFSGRDDFHRMIYPYSSFYTAAAGVNANAGHGPANIAGAVNVI